MLRFVKLSTFNRCCVGLTLAFVIVACAALRVCALEGTWVDLNPDTPDRVTSVNLMDVDFISASTGVTVGINGTILRTVDRGVTWARVNNGTSATLNGVDFIDATNATAVGSNGTILRSDDGGLTWFAQSSGTQETLLDVHFVDGLTGTAVGFAGTIRRTTDGGATWSSQISGTDTYLTAVFFVDAQQGYAVGSKGTILRTGNGGGLWLPNTSGKICRYHHGITLCNSFVDVQFLDASTGFVAGFPADPAYLAGGSFYKTLSGGNGWVKQIPPPPTEFGIYAAISFGNSTEGMVLTGLSRLPVA